MAAALAGCLVAASCGQSYQAATHNLNRPGVTASNSNSSGNPDLTVAQYKTTSELPASTGRPKSTAAVAVLSLDSGTEPHLVGAFDAYEVLPKTCKAETIPGAVWIAKVRATEVSFAVAGFRPAPSCRTSIDGQTIPPNRYGPFDVLPPPPAGVFERQPRGKWVMTAETGKPFPCPPQTRTGAVPGADSPVVPKDVLDAWHIPYYSSTCVTSVPRQPP